MLLIVFNTTLLAMDRANASDDLVKLEEDGNLACTIIFALEMLIRLLGIGIKGELHHNSPKEKQ